MSLCCCRAFLPHAGHLRLWPRHRSLGWVLLSLLLSGLASPTCAEPQQQPTSATAQSAAQAESDALHECFDRAWHAAHDAPWYLDADGRRTIPETSHAWLIIRHAPSPVHQAVAQSGPAAATPPPVGVTGPFENRYAAFFDYRLPLPDAEDGTLYRVRPGLPYGAFEALVKRLREDPEVRYALPVWRLAERLEAPLNQIRVTWKTVATHQERERLLRSAGAASAAATTAPNTQRVRIDPCRMAPWQAAVLLAEDLRVIRALPQTVPVEPPVAILLRMDTPGALAGTPLPFRLEIRFGERIRIASATLADLDLKPPGIYRNLCEIRYDQPLSTIDLTRNPIVVTGHVTLYAAGEFSLPGVPVYYTDLESTDKTIKKAQSPGTPVRIAALVPEANTDYHLQVAEPAPMVPLTLPGLAGRRRTALLLGCAGLVLLTLAATLWLRWRPRLRPVIESASQRRRRHAREALVSWLDGATSAPQPDEVAALGTALRHYLAEAAGLPPDQRGGSATLFLGRLAGRLPETVLQQAESLLGQIEHHLAGGEPAAFSERTASEQLKGVLSALEQRTFEGEE